MRKFEVTGEGEEELGGAIVGGVRGRKWREGEGEWGDGERREDEREGGRSPVNGSNQVGEWSQRAEELKREKGRRRRK